LLVNDDLSSSIELQGQCDNKQYPLSKKYHKLETLRKIAHLRPRSNLGAAVARTRNQAMFASHLYF